MLIVSVLALALSVYSFGYVRGFYGRKSVGVLAAFYNALLLATTLVFTASNAFFFLIAWEIMALTAYCLVSFEHEKSRDAQRGRALFHHVARRHRLPDPRFPAAVPGAAGGDYSFDSFRALGDKMSAGPARRGVPAVPVRLRRQGGHRAAAHLAAGGASGRAQQRLGLACPACSSRPASTA